MHDYVVNKSHNIRVIYLGSLCSKGLPIGKHKSRNENPWEIRLYVIKRPIFYRKNNMLQRSVYKVRPLVDSVLFICVYFNLSRLVKLSQMWTGTEQFVTHTQTHLSFTLLSSPNIPKRFLKRMHFHRAFLVIFLQAGLRLYCNNFHV